MVDMELITEVEKEAKLTKLDHTWGGYGGDEITFS